MAAVLKVKRLAESSKLPTRGSLLAAGYDLYASENIVVEAKSRALVPTGIAVALPAGTYGRIAPRSGLAVEHGIDIGAGVVDADYRGEIKVLMFNHGNEDYSVTMGSRIAQLIIERIETPDAP